MFVERYMHAIGSPDLRDDEFHTATLPLRASTYADATGNEVVLGSLLCRVKYGSVARREFETGADDMVKLIRDWSAAVVERGRARGWMKTTTPWDVEAAFKLYERVAHASLAFWIDSNCTLCKGAKVDKDRRMCTCCGGSGKAQVEAGRFESGIILDLVSELDGIYQSHNRRAAALLRKAA
jgi:hypothetical protein